MNDIKFFSRRILLWSFCIMMLLAVLLTTCGYYSAHFLSTAISIPVLQDAANYSEPLKQGLDKILPIAEMAQNFYIPAVFVVFILFTFILWICLRSSISRILRKFVAGDGSVAGSGEKEKVSGDVNSEPVITKKELKEINKRFYLQLLSVLQREGRLIDFFSEDLSMYEDSQIGAAVRSIQDNCKKSLKKYLNPKAVIDQNEGDPVIVPVGFDPNSIKLTGNVSGEPPFKGTLRHKGWRASRLELPTLSPVNDPSILSPAEIEII